MTNYILYKHTFPNGKLYFGITSRPPEERWRKDGSGYKNNPSMWRAIQKYGWDNVKHEILFENLSEDIANKLEIEYIDKYQTQNRKFGYNIRAGGLVASGWHHTDEAKRKVSAAVTGKCKGIVPWNRGKYYGKIKVYQYTLTGELLGEYASVHEASVALNIPEANIFDNIELRSKSCYGYIFSKIISNDIYYKAEPGAHKIMIYQYDNLGTLVGVYRSYKMAIEATCVSESCLEDCLNGRQKTSHGFVFSKIELTPDEVQKHYCTKKRKQKYKYLLIYKETGEKILYNTVDEMAQILNIKSTVLRNVINGASSSLNKKYTFKRIDNED